MIDEKQAEFLVENYEESWFRKIAEGYNYLCLPSTECRRVVAIDNMSGDAFTEEFETLTVAMLYLENEDLEVDDLIKLDAKLYQQECTLASILCDESLDIYDIFELEQKFNKKKRKIKKKWLKNLEKVNRNFDNMREDWE